MEIVTGLLLDVQSTTGYVSTSFRFVRIELDANGYVTKVRNYGGDEPRAGLTVTAQANNDTPEKLYGWSVEYDHLGTMDLRGLRSRTKELGLLLRKVTKLEEAEGPTMAFWQYANRVARAAGAVVIVRSDGNAQEYDQNTYHIVKPIDLAWCLKSEIETATGPKLQAV